MRVRVARFVDRALSLAAVTALGFAKQNWPATVWTTINRVAPLNTLVLIVVASVFSFSPLSSYAERRKLPLREIERRKILTAYGSMLDKAIGCGLAVSDPALHVWKTSRSKAKRLVTYRLSEVVHLRKFAPKQGVGVVGLCWRDGEEKGFDVEALSKELDSEEKFNAYASRDSDGVMNFDWSEFQRLKHRGAVFASPVLRNERVVGMVTFDASSRYPELAHSGIQGELNKLAATLTDSIENLG